MNKQNFVLSLNLLLYSDKINASPISDLASAKGAWHYILTGYACTKHIVEKCCKIVVKFLDYF